MMSRFYNISETVIFFVLFFGVPWLVGDSTIILLEPISKSIGPSWWPYLGTLVVSSGVWFVWLLIMASILWLYNISFAVLKTVIQALQFVKEKVKENREPLCF